jgi:hypothetical protein
MKRFYQIKINKIKMLPKINNYKKVFLMEINNLIEISIINRPRV